MLTFLSLSGTSDSEDYIQTLGVNFMEKSISIRSTEITFSVSSPFFAYPLFKESLQLTE